MAAEMVDVVVWVLIDGDGDYVMARDREALSGRYEEEFTTFDSSVTTRYVKLSFQVPKPQTVELVALVPDEPSAGPITAS